MEENRRAKRAAKNFEIWVLKNIFWSLFLSFQTGLLNCEIFFSRGGGRAPHWIRAWWKYLKKSVFQFFTAIAVTRPPCRIFELMLRCGVKKEGWGWGERWESFRPPLHLLRCYGNGIAFSCLCFICATALQPKRKKKRLACADDSGGRRRLRLAVCFSLPLLPWPITAKSDSYPSRRPKSKNVFNFQSQVCVMMVLSCVVSRSVQFVDVLRPNKRQFWFWINHLCTTRIR